MTVDKRAWILRKARNEYGKQIRKAYEKHEISERRCNMTDYVPRTDGISNTLTTVQSDNYMLEFIGGGTTIRSMIIMEKVA
jgi:DNA (cytosine-5)-methyltransferase 3A